MILLVFLIEKKIAKHDIISQNILNVYVCLVICKTHTHTHNMSNSNNETFKFVSHCSINPIKAQKNQVPLLFNWHPD